MSFPQPAKAADQQAQPAQEANLEALIFQAEKGDSNAQALLGRKYLEGEGVDIDINKAFEWLQKSVAQNNPEAQLYLASYYINIWVISW